MLKIGLRYDMRAPDLGPGSTSARELYEAVVAQCRWADEHGVETVYLAEHHGAEDGYCPSPIVLAAAIAGATSQIRIHLSALCITLHQPLRLAEDLAVLDLLAGAGRILVTAGMGYRPHEFAMLDADYDRRARSYETNLAVLRDAWRGAAFTRNGAEVRVTPAPATPGGPHIYIGGSAEPSARRAARLGLGYRPATRELYERFQEHCRALGRPEPEAFPEHGPAFVHVTRDPDRDWVRLAPHLRHAGNLYAQWAGERATGASNGYWQHHDGTDELRADPNLWVVTPEQLLSRCERLPADYELRMHPLLGGIPPELSWQSLRLFGEQVLPALSAAGRRPRA